uniref:ATP synthase CF0 A chain n=2 Tax=Chromera velia TaxID=505693 RepID=D9IXE4_9ALVE|nr:ATP synthase CF0 A chain [Chromera velia]ADJ66552.1 ATP synthase CF0 A chain [Chromera velia]
MFLNFSIAVHYCWNICNFTFHGETLLMQWLFFSLFNYFFLRYWYQYDFYICKNKGFNLISFFWAYITFRYFYKQQNTNLNLLHPCNMGEAFIWSTYIFVWFSFIFFENWVGVIFPKFLFHLPLVDLTAATADINTTVGLALLVVISSFYQRYKTEGIWFVKNYLEPLPLLLPLNIVEEFTKPLSLSFRLFGNILADELTGLVITSLIPLGIPIPLIALGLFAGYIQTIIFINLTFDYIFE